MLGSYSDLYLTVKHSIGMPTKLMYLAGFDFVFSSLSLELTAGLLPVIKVSVNKRKLLYP